jgi:hypothetical protein
LTVTRPASALRRLWLSLRYSLGNPVYLLVVLGVLFQSGHIFEHFAQMYEHLVLGWPARESHGIIASADIESMHFFANVIVLLVIAVAYYGWEFQRADGTTRQFKAMTWTVRGLFILQGYHVVEHTAKYYQHLRLDVQGTPGLIGYVLGPKLIYFHFVVNVIVYLGMVALLAMYTWNMQLYPAYLAARARRHLNEYARIANADGKLTGEERDILVRMRYDLDMYSREILERLQAGATSGELKARLHEMQRALVDSATAQAMVDGRITADERRLIQAVAENNPIADVIAKLEELHDKDHVPDEPRGEGTVGA